MTSDESSISTQNPVNGSNIPPPPPPPPQKKKRNLPGTPDPDAEVIGLSPKTLMATNRFLCEICGKGFQRDQNLQLHRRGHNLPWKLKQRATGSEVRKRVYICPEKTCVHHHPSRALGDLTGIKKHFCRKHGDKKWKCDKCSKRYAVQSDWKAHSKTCGTREYKCHCGTIFSRRDSFITHRAFCDALAQETARVTAAATHHHNHNHNMNNAAAPNLSYQYFLGPPSLGMMPQLQVHLPSLDLFKTTNDDQNLLDPFPMAMGRGPAIFTHEPTHSYSTSKNPPETHLPAAFTTTTSFSNLPVASTYYNVMNWDFGQKLIPGQDHPEMANNSSSSSSIPVTFKEVSVPSLFSSHDNEGNNDQERATATARMSATALLQKAAQIGATTSDPAAMILGTSSSSTFGVIKCNNININNNNAAAAAAAAVHDKLQAQVLCGLYSTSSCCSSDDVERSSANEMISINRQQQQMMYSASKRRRIQNIHDEEVMICTEADEGGETRDFLGVGINPICHPSSINGIAWL